MTMRCGLLVLFALVCWPTTLLAAEPREWVAANLEPLLELYRHLHQNPELSLHEEKTSERMAKELRALGAEVTTGVGGYGVAALLKNGAGPTIMVRTDMDALPVTENTQLVYASKVVVPDGKGGQTGVMHACGHDIHMTNLVGVARYLAANKDRWQGTAMFVCQPAEEYGDGAKKMLDAGLFDKIAKPQFALALHCDSKSPTGTVGYKPGYVLANVDSVDITIRGRGGHGAYPHTTVDPIVQAARLVLDLQTIVSREINPIEPSVITVGSIRGGTKHNVIADTCKLELTVRSYSEQVRQHLLAAIKRKALATASSAGAPEPTIDVSEGTPATFNDEKLVERLLPTLQKALGEENVTRAEASMGGEDFSEYGRAGVPSFIFWLGTVDAKRLARYEQIKQEPPSLHSPIFYPDADAALTTGVTAMANCVLDLMPPKK
jgi:hippurate hydrolase